MPRPTSSSFPGNMLLTFSSFAREIRNPVPLLEVLESGRYRTGFLAPDADVRTDIPKYNIYRKGKLEKTVKEIKRPLEG